MLRVETHQSKVEHSQGVCVPVKREIRRARALKAKVRDLPLPRSFLPTPEMASTSRQHKGRDVVLPTLDVFIQTLNIAKDACGIPPAQIALGSASTLLTMIRVHFPLLC